MKDQCIKCGKVVPWVCVFGNAADGVFKIFVGTVAHSKGLVADGLHSSADVCGTLMVIVCLAIAGQETDDSHPWGHGKIEFIGALFVYSMLFFLSIYIFWDALAAIIEGAIKTPKLYSAVAAAVSVMVNYILSSYGFCVGNKLNSPALIANANENRADMLTSIAVFFTIIGANLGYAILDPLSAIIVAGMICHSAVTLGSDAFRNILDVSLPYEKIKRVKDTILQFTEVKGIRYLKIRRMGQSVWIDLEIFVDAKKTVKDSYALTQEIRLAMIRRFKHIKEIAISFTCKEQVESQPSKKIIPVRFFKPFYRQKSVISK